MVDQNELETQIKNIDEHTARIEQILPTLATKDDLKAYATMDAVREEGEHTRRHFDVVAEQMKQDIALIAEGQKALATSVNSRFHEADTTLESHDKRLMKLEAESMKRRR